LNEAQGKVHHSASVLGATYREVSAFPEPARSVLQDDVRRYRRSDRSITRDGQSLRLRVPYLLDRLD